MKIKNVSPVSVSFTDLRIPSFGSGRPCLEPGVEVTISDESAANSPQLTWLLNEGSIVKLSDEEPGDEGPNGNPIYLFLDSAKSVGGSQYENFSIPGLKSTDHILSMTSMWAGANASTPLGFNPPQDNSLFVTFNEDPGVGAKVRVFIMRTPITATQVISVINRNTIVDDATLKRYCDAMQTQITRDFIPAYGLTRKYFIEFIGANEPEPLGSWKVFIRDVSDIPEDLGYHQYLNDTPIANVFTSVGIVSTTLSHELLEMIGNPTASKTVVGPLGEYMYEVSDACEADEYGYFIGDVQVCDFVLPSWFSTDVPTAPVDFMGFMTEPFSLLPGGYLTYWNGSAWITVNG